MPGQISRSNDTIAALSSAPGPSRRMVLRVTGPATFAIGRSLGLDTATHRALLRQTLRLEQCEVPAKFLTFAGPASATGEDVLELHLPGSVPLGRMVLRALFAAGARPAEPGEFTARGYFHGKLSLAAAEGVGVAVAAENAAELRAARQLMAGALADRLAPAMNGLADMLALVEVGIDFSDEDVTFLPADEVRRRIAEIEAVLVHLLAEAPRLESLHHRPGVVLVGRPNAGKSTLLNALAGRQRAVTSDVAGTTRDLVSVTLALPRGDVELIDAAGLDVAGDDLERQMQHRAHQAAASAEVLVLVREPTDDQPPIDLPQPPTLTVLSKADLATDADSAALAVSAVTGSGLHALRAAIDEAAFGRERAGVSLAARHVREIDAARTALTDAAEQADVPELAAADLRRALDHLGEVLGEITPDDVLGRVFSSFCIGK